MGEKEVVGGFRFEDRVRKGEGDVSWSGMSYQVRRGRSVGVVVLLRGFETVSCGTRAGASWCCREWN